MFADPTHVTLSLFLTGAGSGNDEGPIEHGKLPNRTFGRRLGPRDLVGAIDGFQPDASGGRGREGVVCYVCGPPRMTDEMVEFLGRQEGMEEERVLCEKCW